MEGIDVPIRGPVAQLDDVECQLVRGRDDSAAGFSLSEKLLLSDLLGLRVMRDKDDVDVVILCSKKADHPEVERSRYILFEFTH